MTPRTVALTTLGCKTNQFESVAMQQRLQEAGYQVVDFAAGADLVIVNTCTVTAATDAQSRNLIRRARRLNPDCQVVVTGCYAQIDPQALAALPEVSLVLGNEEKADFLRHLEDDASPRVVVSPIREIRRAAVPVVGNAAERSRAFVQIQNGCDAFCSYCIIPYARGASRSVLLPQVVEQVRTLFDAGYPEVVLTGIHIGGYGLDVQPATTLTALIEQLLPLPDGVRLRLGSLEPTEVPDTLLDLFAAQTQICPHLHIPLQSGCDTVLARMNRTYDTAFFAALLQRVVARLPDVAIGLDVIVGFPGESEAEFTATVDFLEALPFSHLHVFPFSRRPGTPAASMPGQVPGDVIKKRAAHLRTLGSRKLQSYAARFIGRELDLVVESGGRGREQRGLSANYLSVRFSGDPDRAGHLQRVRVVGVAGEQLLAEPL